MGKNILITPHVSDSSNPRIDFTGNSSGNIRLEVLDDGTLAFIGNSGSLFSITDDVSGTLMAVSDMSGLPILEVLSTNEVDVNGYLINDGSIRSKGVILIYPPVNASDAVNKLYVDSSFALKTEVSGSLGNYVKKSGDTMTGNLTLNSSLSVNGQVMIGSFINPSAYLNINTPVNGNIGLIIQNTSDYSSTYAIQLKDAYGRSNIYMKSYSSGVGAYSGELYVNNVVNVGYGTYINGNTIKNYYDGYLSIQYGGGITQFGGKIGIGTYSPSTFLDVSGNIHIFANAAIDGSLWMNNQKIMGIQTPANSSDAVNKFYVDNVSFGLTRLLDISIKNPLNNDILQYDSSKGLWVNISPENASDYFVMKTGDTMSGRLNVDSCVHVNGAFEVSTANSRFTFYDYTVESNTSTIFKANNGYMSYRAPNHVEFWSYTDGDIKLYGRGYNDIALIVKPDSKNVGISDPSPLYRLDVSGNFHTKGAVFIDGSLNLQNQRIIGVQTPVNSSDAVNKFYVDSSLNDIVDWSTLFYSPGYIDNSLNQRLLKTTDTFTGILTLDGSLVITRSIGMYNQKITGLATPTSSSDAVNKFYVDSSFITTERLEASLNNYLFNTTDSFTGALTIDGSLILHGDFYQDGSTYVIHAETIYTEKDFIILREGAVGPLADGSISGVKITKPNGTNDVIFGTGKDAIMRVGWDASSLVALAAREDKPIAGAFAYWDDSSSIFKTRNIDASFALKSDINSSLGLYVLKTGDTMTGNLVVNTSIGIGTASPAAALHIYHNNNTHQLIIQSTSGSLGDTAGILFATTSSATYIKGGIFFERIDGTAQGTLHFATSNSGGAEVINKSKARLSITKDGYVGIGIPNASNYLDVSGNIHATGSVKFDNSVNIDGSLSVKGVIYATNVATSIRGATNNSLNIIGHTNANGQGVIIQVNAGGTYGNRAFIVEHTGKVGIMTLTPAYTLDVSGDLRVMNSLIVNISGDVSVYKPVLFDASTFILNNIPNVSTNYVLYYDTTSKKVSYSTAPAGTGNVDVTKAYVDGSLATLNASVNTAFLTNGSLGNHEIRIAYLDACLGTTSILAQAVNASISSYVQKAGDTMTGNLTVNASILAQKIGIGTLIPAMPLEVSSNATSTGVRYSSGITTQQWIIHNFVTGTYRATAGFTEQNAGWDFGLYQIGGGSNPSDMFYIGRSGLRYDFTVNRQGHVGIGTAVPTYQLDVSGNLRVTGPSYLNGAIYNTSIGIINTLIYALNSSLNAYATNSSVNTAFLTNSSLGKAEIRLAYIDACLGTTSVLTRALNASINLYPTNASIATASFTTNSSIANAFAQFVRSASIAASLGLKWDSGHVDVSITSNLKFTNGALDTSIGAVVSSFAALTDGSITNPSTNDTLKWDASWGKWMNKPDLWDLSTNNSTVYLKDPCDNVELSYIEMAENGGALTLVDLPCSSTATASEQSYAMKIDGSNAFRIYGTGAGTVLNSTAVVVDANYFSLGDPAANGSWRFMIDTSGNLSVEKRVGGVWVVKGNFI